MNGDPKVKRFEAYASLRQNGDIQFSDEEMEKLLANEADRKSFHQYLGNQYGDAGTYEEWEANWFPEYSKKKDYGAGSEPSSVFSSATEPTPAASAAGVMGQQATPKGILEAQGVSFVTPPQPVQKEVETPEMLEGMELGVTPESTATRDIAQMAQFNDIILERQQNYIKAIENVPASVLSDPARAFNLLVTDEAARKLHNDPNASDYIKGQIKARTITDAMDLVSARLSLVEQGLDEAKLDRYSNTKSALIQIYESGDPNMVIDGMNGAEWSQEWDYMLQSNDDLYEYDALNQAMYSLGKSYENIKGTNPTYFKEIEKQRNNQIVGDIYFRATSGGILKYPRLVGIAATNEVKSAIQGFMGFVGAVGNSFGNSAERYNWADKWAEKAARMDWGFQNSMPTFAQRDLFTNTAKVGNYQVDVTSTGDVAAVRDSQGYLVVDNDVRNQVVEQYESAPDKYSATFRPHLAPAVSVAVQGAVQVAMTSKFAGLGRTAAAAKGYAAGMLTARFAGQNYIQALEEFGPENADVAARFAIATAALQSGISMYVNPLEIKLNPRFNVSPKTLKAVAKDLAEGKSKEAAIRNGFRAYSADMAKGMVQYTKEVAKEGFEGLMEYGVDVGGRMLVRSTTDINAEYDLSANAAANSFVSELIGASLAAGAAIDTRAAWQKESMLIAYENRAEILPMVEKMHGAEVAAKLKLALDAADKRMRGQKLTREQKNGIVVQEYNKTIAIDEEEAAPTPAAQPEPAVQTQAEPEAEPAVETSKEVVSLPTIYDVAREEAVALRLEAGDSYKGSDGTPYTVVDEGDQTVTLRNEDNGHTFNRNKEELRKEIMTLFNQTYTTAFPEMDFRQIASIRRGMFEQASQGVLALPSPTAVEPAVQPETMIEDAEIVPQAQPVTPIQTEQQTIAPEAQAPALAPAPTTETQAAPAEPQVAAETVPPAAPLVYNRSNIEQAEGIDTAAIATALDVVSEIVPDMQVRVFETQAEMEATLGQRGNAFVSQDGKTIYISKESNAIDVQHEVIHPIMVAAELRNPGTIELFYDQIMNKLPERVRDDLEVFQLGYSDKSRQEQREEVVVEFLARLASGQYEMTVFKQEGVLDAIVNWFDAIFVKLGLTNPPNNLTDIKSFSRKIVEAFRTRSAVTFEYEDDYMDFTPVDVINTTDEKPNMTLVTYKGKDYYAVRSGIVDTGPSGEAILGAAEDGGVVRDEGDVMSEREGIQETGLSGKYDLYPVDVVDAEGNIDYDSDFIVEIDAAALTVKKDLKARRDHLRLIFKGEEVFIPYRDLPQMNGFPVTSNPRPWLEKNRPDLLSEYDAAMQKKAEVAQRLDQQMAAMKKDLKARFTDSKMEAIEDVNDIRGRYFYHGTARDFDTFDKSFIGSKTDAGWWGRGIYFHTDPDRGGYGEIVKKVKLSPTKPLILPIDNSGEYLYDILDNLGYGQDIKRSASAMSIIASLGSDNFTNILTSAGYDSMIINYQQGTAEVVVFDTNIINIDDTLKARFTQESLDPQYFRAKKWMRDEMNQKPPPLRDTVIQHAMGIFGINRGQAEIMYDVLWRSPDRKRMLIPPGVQTNRTGLAGMLDKAQQFRNEWLLKSQGMPMEVLRGLEGALGENELLVRRMMQSYGRIMKIIDNHKNKDERRDLRETANRFLDGRITDAQIASLPSPLYAELRQMRAWIDEVSAEILNDANMSEMRTEIISANMGEYVGRFFRVHLFGKYSPEKASIKKFMDEYRRRNYEAVSIANPTWTADQIEAELRRKGEQAYKDLLQKHAIDTKTGGQRSSKISKPTGMMKEREQIPKRAGDLWEAIDEQRWGPMTLPPAPGPVSNTGNPEFEAAFNAAWNDMRQYRLREAYFVHPQISAQFKKLEKVGEQLAKLTHSVGFTLTGTNPFNKENIRMAVENRTPFAFASLPPSATPAQVKQFNDLLNELNDGIVDISNRVRDRVNLDMDSIMANKDQLDGTDGFRDLQHLTPGVRAILGEIPPLEATVLTMANMARYYTMNKYYRMIRALGEGNFLFRADDPNRPTWVNKRIPGREQAVGMVPPDATTEKMAPLSGLYTTPEIYDILMNVEHFNEGVGIPGVFTTTGAFAKFSGKVQEWKTIFSPQTQARNFLSNLFFVVRNSWADPVRMTLGFAYVPIDYFMMRTAGKRISTKDVGVLAPLKQMSDAFAFSIAQNFGDNVGSNVAPQMDANKYGFDPTVASDLSNFQNAKRDMFAGMKRQETRALLVNDAVNNYGMSEDNARRLYADLQPKSFQDQMSKVLNKLAANGVIGTNINMRLIQSYMGEIDTADKAAAYVANAIVYEDASPFARAMRMGYNKWKDFNANAGRFYSFGDDTFKIFGYLRERAQYSKLLFSKEYFLLSEDQQAEVDAIAMENVKNIIPNYDRIGKLGKWFSRDPFFAQFIAFKIESMRVWYNLFSLANKEIRDGNKSGNAEMVRHGYTRLATHVSMVGVTTAAEVGLATFLGNTLAEGAQLLGNYMSSFWDDDDEDEKKKALRDPLPDWMQNDILAISKAVDGKVTYISVSANHPFGDFQRTLVELSETTEINLTEQPYGVQIGLVSVIELFEQFWQTKIATAVLIEIVSNKDSYGREIWNKATKDYEGDTDGVMFQKILSYAMRRAGPAWIGQASRVGWLDWLPENEFFSEFRKPPHAAAPVQEIAAMVTGFKPITVDFYDQFKRRVGDFANYPGTQDEIYKKAQHWNLRISDATFEEQIKRMVEEEYYTLASLHDAYRLPVKHGIVEASKMDEILTNKRDQGGVALSGNLYNSDGSINNNGRLAHMISRGVYVAPWDKISDLVAKRKAKKPDYQPTPELDQWIRSFEMEKQQDENR